VLTVVLKTLRCPAPVCGANREESSSALRWPEPGSAVTASRWFAPLRFCDAPLAAGAAHSPARRFPAPPQPKRRLKAISTKPPSLQATSVMASFY